MNKNIQTISYKQLIFFKTKDEVFIIYYFPLFAI